MPQPFASFTCCLALFVLLIGGLVMRPILFQVGEIHDIEQIAAPATAPSAVDGMTDAGPVQDDPFDLVLHVVETEHWPVLAMTLSVAGGHSYGMVRSASHALPYPDRRLASPFRPPIIGFLTA